MHFLIKTFYMFESRLLLNVMPLFHENLFTIRFCFVKKNFFSFGELNFSQDFVDERRGIASVSLTA